jgi:hypothetical protein
MSRKRGIRRLALVLGLVCAVPVVCFLLFAASDDFNKGANMWMSDLGYIALIGGVVFLLAWGSVRLIGWIIDGFAGSEPN